MPPALTKSTQVAIKKGKPTNRNASNQKKDEWWVEIKTKDGTVGWTEDTHKFNGKDALGI